MMLFGKTEQVIQVDDLVIVRRHHPVIAAKHLMYLAAQDFEIRSGDMLLSGMRTDERAPECRTSSCLNPTNHAGMAPARQERVCHPVRCARPARRAPAESVR